MRAEPREAVALAGLVASSVLLVLMLPGLAANSSWRVLADNALYSAWVVAWLLVVTVATRTIMLRTVVAWWFIGFFPLIGLNFLLQQPLAWLLGTDGVFVAALWVPAVEEVTKVLPLVVVIVLGIRSRWQAYGPSDLLVLSATLGAAFRFHEDALWGRTVGSGFDLFGWGLLFPVFNTDGRFLLIGHMGWTTAMGVALGVWVVLRWYGHGRLGWLVPAITLALVTYHHAANNLVAFATRQSTVLRVSLWFMDVMGPAFAVLIVIGVVSAVAVELHRLQGFQQVHPQLPMPRSAHAKAALAAPNAATVVLRGYAGLRYLRTANAVRYAAADRREPLDATALTPGLMAWGRLAGLLR